MLTLHEGFSKFVGFPPVHFRASQNGKLESLVFIKPFDMENNFKIHNLCSLYPKIVKQEKKKLKTTCKSYNQIVEDKILAQPPNFKGQIVTEVRECRSFALWPKLW